MKKTVSMLLAVLMAAIAVCTFGMSAFADETENDDPNDGVFVTTTTTTEEAKTTTTTTAAAEEETSTTTTTTAAEGGDGEGEAETTTNILDNILGALVSTTKSVAEMQSELDAEAVVTNPEGVTAIVPDETTAVTAAAATTKKTPAKVESNIPSTGSTAVPVIALLALAAGTVAVVKTKKED